MKLFFPASILLWTMLSIITATHSWSIGFVERKRVEGNQYKEKQKLVLRGLQHEGLEGHEGHEHTEEEHVHEGKSNEEEHAHEEHDHEEEHSHEEHDHEEEHSHEEHDHEEDHAHEEHDHEEEHSHAEHDHEEEHAYEEHDHAGYAHESYARDGDRPWGPALLAALLVNCCTLIGVVFFVPARYFGKSVSVETKGLLLHNIIPSFACGALLATAVFLMIPESLALLTGLHESHGEHNHRLLEGNTESEAAWKFGISALGGYFLPSVFSIFLPHSHVPGSIDAANTKDTAVAEEKIEKAENETANIDPGVSTEESSQEVTKDMSMKDGSALANSGDARTTNSKLVEANQQHDLRLAVTILAGDVFHNFSDGVFIGTAFLLCDQSLAITVTATTVFHELCQELADYFLLTNQCGYPTWKALLMNFVSGLSVMLGVIVIFAVNVTPTAVGCILSVGAGVYYYVALTECASRVRENLTNLSDRLWSLSFWIIGTIPIGLVLLNHTHCDG